MDNLVNDLDSFLEWMRSDLELTVTYDFVNWPRINPFAMYLQTKGFNKEDIRVSSILAYVRKVANIPTPEPLALLLDSWENLAEAQHVTTFNEFLEILDE